MTGWLRRLSDVLLGALLLVPRLITNLLLAGAALIGTVLITDPDLYPGALPGRPVVVAVILLAVAGLGAPLYNAVLDVHARRERVHLGLADLRTLVDMDDVLAPLMDDLVELALARTDEAAEAAKLALVSSSLYGLSRLPGPSQGRIRACYYEVSDDGQRLELVDRPRGRSDAARQTIEATSTRGKDTLKSMRAGKPVVYPDLIRGEKPKGWAQEGEKQYRSFMRVPVLNKSGVYGVLTVDSTVAGEINDADTPVVQMTARVLATAASVRAAITERQ